MLSRVFRPLLAVRPGCVVQRGAANALLNPARSFATNKKPPPPSKGPSGPDSTKPPGAPDRSTASAGGVAAATAGQGARTTPYLKLLGRDGKAAQKLLDDSVKAGKVDEVDSDLRAFKMALRDDIRVKNAVSFTFLKKEKQIANMQAILQALFPTMGDISKNYVLASIEDREISNIGKVSDAFSQLARDYKGEVETKIISAEKLSPEQKKKVVAALQANIEPWQTLKVVYQIDPSILGGLKVFLGDRYADVSTEREVSDISKKLSTFMASPEALKDPETRTQKA